MTTHPDLFALLATPFEAHEIKRRSVPGGRQISYITARTAMNRLDDVLGPENWWDEYVPSEKSVLCRLTIRLPDGSTITKADAGGYAGMPDSGDDDKSGFSDAFKRAAVKFGVARYLYGDGVPGFAAPKATPAAAPKLSPVSTPEPPRKHRPAPADFRPGPNGRDRPPSRPQTGRALFAWLKQMTATHQLELLGGIAAWGRERGWSARVIEWTPDQVQAAYDECCARIREASVHENSVA